MSKVKFKVDPVPASLFDGTVQAAVRVAKEDADAATSRALDQAGRMAGQGYTSLRGEQYGADFDLDIKADATEQYGTGSITVTVSSTD